MSNNGKPGGLLKGKTHEEGGMSAIIVNDGNRPIEVETEEVILTAPAMKSNDQVVCEGTPKGVASAINNEYGGVSFSNEGTCEVIEKKEAGGPLEMNTEQTNNQTNNNTAMEKFYYLQPGSFIKEADGLRYQIISHGREALIVKPYSEIDKNTEELPIEYDNLPNLLDTKAIAFEGKPYESERDIVLLYKEIAAIKTAFAIADVEETLKITQQNLSATTEENKNYQHRLSLPGKMENLKTMLAEGGDLMVANEIRKQIGGKALYMLGAKNLAGDEKSLQFDIRGSQRFNRIKIQLNGKDLYDVTFYKIVKYDVKDKKVVEDIYFDQLHEVIERETGLYTKLKQGGEIPVELIIGHKYKRDSGMGGTITLEYIGKEDDHYKFKNVMHKDYGGGNIETLSESEVKLLMPANSSKLEEGGTINPQSYFTQLNLYAIPPRVADYISYQILPDEGLTELNGDDESFRDISNLIEDNYHECLLPPADEVVIETASDSLTPGQLDARLKVINKALANMPDNADLLYRKEFVERRKAGGTFKRGQLAEDYIKALEILQHVGSGLDKANFKQHNKFFKAYSALAKVYYDNVVELNDEFEKGGNVSKSNPEIPKYIREIIKNVIANAEKEGVRMPLLFDLSTGDTSNLAGVRDEFNSIVNNGASKTPLRVPYDESSKFREWIRQNSVIPDNYTGKTSEQVWNSWNGAQRIHFLNDHFRNVKDSVFAANYSKKEFGDLSDEIKIKLDKHISDGQYAGGGFFDKVKHHAKNAHAAAKKGYGKAEAYTKKKIHDKKKDIAIEVIEESRAITDDKRDSSLLGEAADLVAGIYEKGGDLRSLCPEGTEIQTLIFSKNKFPFKLHATKWAKQHKFKHNKVDVEKNTFHLRQQSPKNFRKKGFNTITLTDGIQAIVGCPTSAAMKRKAA